MEFSFEEAHKVFKEDNLIWKEVLEGYKGIGFILVQIHEHKPGTDREQGTVTFQIIYNPPENLFYGTKGNLFSNTLENQFEPLRYPPGWNKQKVFKEINNLEREGKTGREINNFLREKLKK